MRATTKEQKEVERLHELLPALTMEQLNWIAGQDYEGTAEQYAKQKKLVAAYDYYSVVTTIKGWQVVRYYLVHSKTTRNGHRLEYVYEVSQRWLRLKEQGEISLHIFERQKAMCWYYHAQPYCLDSPMTLKSWNKTYNRGGRTEFYLADYEVVPGRRFTKQFRDAGLAKCMGRVDEIDLVISTKKVAEKIDGIRLCKKEVYPLTQKCYLPNMCETLFKIGEPKLAQMMLTRSWHKELLRKYWTSFLVARRHGLHNTDWVMWLDYVHDLETLGRDIHSPKYLVPADMGVAHGRLIKKIQQMRTEAQREKERQEIANAETGYHNRMKAYFGIKITTKSGLTITPLQSVQAFLEEGTAMDHCVYTCGYYKKDTCLILSARDKDGKRVETIEVNLTDYHVAQSRGVRNKPTEYHDEIVKAMKANMGQIRSIREAKTMRLAS